MRELAVEFSPLVRVNGVAPATVVAGIPMFPRDRVIASLAKYKIPFDETDIDEVAHDKLAQFYADRTLTKTPITPGDQAEAVFFLPPIARENHRPDIPVDGGLQEAFVR